jgi:aryl-alcohol dehydrogenase-like predicted oxidoreductase
MAMMRGEAFAQLEERPKSEVKPASFPRYAGTGIFGAGTYQAGSPDLIEAALALGVTLVDTSPDYRNGEAEHRIGDRLRFVDRPVFVMTQIPVEAWESDNRRRAFQRALEQSLRRLRRGQVEALLVRNAEPGQVEAPAFRDFAAAVKEHGLVQHIGASGHGPDLEKVLERGLEDDLIDLYLVGAHLATSGNMPDLLREARERGKLLVAMKSREAALWARLPGWEREEERRRHAPWDGRWDPAFTRRGLDAALEATGAHNAVLSLRHPEDLAAIVPAG